MKTSEKIALDGVRSCVFSVLLGGVWPIVLLVATAGLFAGIPFLLSDPDQSVFTGWLRYQIVVLSLWVSLFFFINARIATVSDFVIRRQMATFARSCGASPIKIFISLVAAAGKVALLLALPFIAGGVLAMGPASLWVITQQALLTVAVSLSVFCIAVAGSVCVGGAIGFFVSLFFAVSPFFFPWLLTVFADSSTLPQGISRIALSLWVVFPHFELSDLTSRVVFGWGALPLAEFVGVLLYFFGWFIFLGLVSYAFFRSRFSN